MLSTSFIPRILDKIKEAKTPDRFTKDFLSNTFMIKSSAARAFLPFAKRIGLLNSDGSPTALYKRFRSTDGITSGAAIAQALRKGYSDLYTRNENAHTLSDDKLKGLVIEETGMEADNRVVGAIVGSFKELKKYADFRTPLPPDENEKKGKDEDKDEEKKPPEEGRRPTLNLAYIINLVLPKTDDIGVFNSIFKSLRDNLLR
jgi:hypothetical protein